LLIQPRQNCCNAIKIKVLPKKDGGKEEGKREREKRRTRLELSLQEQ